jgi:cellulose synthase/poly-beta-1,6-N-acetylglucosamine synthase-like glycosyltransferase
MFPKVLLACPTADVKNYCFEQWIENVFSLNYPNYDIIMFDNSNDGGENAKYLQSFVWQKYGQLGERFKAINSLIQNGVQANSTYVKLCMSHNDCRTYALKNNYDYLFHLESDIMPPKDVIQRLMFHKKNVIGGVYYIAEGSGRRNIIYQHLELAPTHLTSIETLVSEEINLMDGEIKKVAQIGLGCVLITRKLLEKIHFRYENHRTCHPDTYFNEDCYSINVPVYADTSIICSHENKAWGIIGLDFI